MQLDQVRAQTVPHYRQRLKGYVLIPADPASLTTRGVPPERQRDRDQVWEDRSSRIRRCRELVIRELPSSSYAQDRSPDSGVGDPVGFADWVRNDPYLDLEEDASKFHPTLSPQNRGSPGVSITG